MTSEAVQSDSGTNTPVQRIEKPSAGSPSAGALSFQLKPIFVSTRVSAGVPSKCLLAKYSPLSPGVLQSAEV